MEDNWTVVTKKKKNIKNEKLNNKNKKPKKFLRTWMAQITQEDTILTKKEKQIIKNELLKNPELHIFCDCCCSRLISDIICRSFFACGKCFCCAGDYYEGGEIYMTGFFHFYNKDYYYKNDDDFE